MKIISTLRTNSAENDFKLELFLTEYGEVLIFF